MGVEAEALKANIGCVKAQDIDDLGACDAACGGGKVGVVSTYQGVGVGTVFPELEETAGSGKYGIDVIHIHGLHGGRLFLDTVLLIVEKDSDRIVSEEVLIQGLLCNDAVFVV